ncbi:hypothetical protein CPLU01_01055 [Colletotrichum plurivorum]|uniref:Uncharacterized protein n=1 Tax=Colletotrichum plurivorum TaxID=2175906 RepID=A0A8H6NQN7_9PEZI|nr:hypothetical protein CPLU01_01055 [Colletotrichum plurivorum]
MRSTASTTSLHTTHHRPQTTPARPVPKAPCLPGPNGGRGQAMTRGRSRGRHAEHGTQNTGHGTAHPHRTAQDDQVNQFARVESLHGIQPAATDARPKAIGGRTGFGSNLSRPSAGSPRRPVGGLVGALGAVVGDTLRPLPTSRQSGNRSQKQPASRRYMPVSLFPTCFCIVAATPVPGPSLSRGRPNPTMQRAPGPYHDEVSRDGESPAAVLSGGRGALARERRKRRSARKPPGAPGQARKQTAVRIVARITKVPWARANKPGRFRRNKDRHEERDNVAKGN